MITRGNIRGNGAQLARYLLREGPNDKVRVLEISGVVFTDDLLKALQEMSLTVELTRRTDKGLYHAVINPAPEESFRFSDQDWIRAADIWAEHAGFTGQPRAIVLHDKGNRRHAHVVFQRYSFERGKIIPNNFSRLKQNNARMQMEQELGLFRTRKKDLDRSALRELATALWHQHSTGQDFIRALEVNGCTAVRSQERHPLRLVDSRGADYDLVRMITGVRKWQVEDRLKGILLPEKKAAGKKLRQAQRNRSAETDRERRVRELKAQMQDHVQKKEKGRGR